LCELGFVLLEHRGSGLFALLSPAPPWLGELWESTRGGDLEIRVAEKSPFLENFLYEADSFWNSNSKGLCPSETWIETSPSGKEIPLEAMALQFEGKRFIALHSPEPQFQERTQLLQTARNALLEHEKLQREIQKKEILLHCIIHDLSQPLSVMSVAFDCMSDEHVSDRGKGLLELGRKATDQQMAMIRDILQVFSEDLKASLQMEGKAESSADLLVSVNSVLSGFTPVYAAKSVKLLLDERVDHHKEWRVHGEATRIDRIFSNLLENALRYTPEGSKVTIGLATEGDFIKASVDDEGPGLPAELSSPQIFALFSKGKEGGGKAGLGLYFCRLTIERWGGTIGCESLPGKGTRFWFRLPRLTTQPGTMAQIAPAVSERGRVKPLALKKYPMRILLADDQSEIRMLTTHQLERSGHHVVAVANGQEVLDALQSESFDVVLLDENMPVMGGLQALRAIREREKNSGPIVVIALTGYNSEPDRERLLRAGFDSVIGKPFRLDALDALLRDSTGSVTPAKEASTTANSVQTPVANLLDRVGGDEKLARKMIATFLHDVPQRMLGIQKAIKQKNGEGLASLAHALKGSVSIFDAQEARDHAQKLQDLGRAKEFRGLARVYEQLKEEIAELEANLRGYAGQKRSPGQGAKQKRRSSSPKQ
jgi:signal transduction histidine kinase/CheY-like chemotaxis protein